MRVRLEHGGVLVAERELDAAVLRALEAAASWRGRAGSRVYSGGVIVASTSQACTSCSMMRDTRASILKACRSWSRRTARDRRAQLVQHELHPQLAGLVLHDEQHLVVVGRQRLLRAQDLVEVQVVAVAHRRLKSSCALSSATIWSLGSLLTASGAHGHPSRDAARVEPGLRHSPRSSTWPGARRRPRRPRSPVYSGVKPKRRMSGRAEVADHAARDQRLHDRVAAVVRAKTDLAAARARARAAYAVAGHGRRSATRPDR